VIDQDDNSKSEPPSRQRQGGWPEIQTAPIRPQSANSRPRTPKTNVYI